MKPFGNPIGILASAAILATASGCSPIIKNLDLAKLGQIGADQTPACDVMGNPFGGGDGSAAAPYRICTLDQLKRIDEEDVAAAYRLYANLDAAGETLPMIGKYAHFVGSFDGGDYAIANLDQQTAYSYNVGLFRIVGAGGKVENLKLKDVDLLFYGTSGALVGELAGGSVKNVSVNGDVKGAYTYGGVIGYAHTGATVENVKFVGNVDQSAYGGTESWSGGVIGRLTNTTAKGLRFEGSMTGGSVIGGLVGLIHPRTPSSNILEESSAEATVTMNKVPTVNHGAGGLVGLCAGDCILRKLAFKGTLTGKRSVGGVVGIQDYGSGLPYAEHSELVVEATIVGDGPGVAGIAGYASEAVTSQAVFVGTVTNLATTGSTNTSGLNGGGCGQRVKQAYVNAVVTGANRVGVITGDGCVSEFEDVLGVGEAHASASLSGGLQGMQWSGSVWSRVLAKVEIHQSAPAQVACTGAMFNQCYGAVGVTGTYYASSAAAGAPEAYGAGLSDSQMEVEANFPEFDFTNTWIMPSSVPWQASPMPVLRWMCGKYGVVCN